MRLFANKLLLVAQLVLCISCGDKPEEVEAASASGGSNSELPAPIEGTGQLAFQVPDDVDAETVEGYIVGKQDTLIVERSGDTYYINNVPPGKQDVIITAGTLNVSALTGKSN